MGESYGRGSLIYVLSPRTGGPECIYFDVIIL